MSYEVSTQLTNLELYRVFLLAIRDGTYSNNDLRVFFKAIYEQFEDRYPNETRWAYNHVSRKYTKQVGEELKEQRKMNARNVTDVYKGVYNEI